MCVCTAHCCVVSCEPVKARGGEGERVQMQRPSLHAQRAMLSFTKFIQFIDHRPWFTRVKMFSVRVDDGLEQIACICPNRGTKR
jgi:hypothetical protein